MTPTGRLNNRQPEMQDLNWGRRRTTVAEHTAAIIGMDLSEIEFRMLEHFSHDFDERPPPVQGPIRVEQAIQMLFEYNRLTKLIAYNREGRHPLHRNTPMAKTAAEHLERKRQRLVDEFPTIPEWYETNKK